MENIYSPSKNQKFYSTSEGLRKIMFSFNKKQKIFFDFFYITLAFKPFHKVAAFFIKAICKFFGYNFFLKTDLVRILFFSGIRGMSLNDIFYIRNNHFNNITKNDYKIPNQYKNIIDNLRKNGFCILNKNLFNISSADIKNVNAYFRNRKFYDGHDPLQSSLKTLDYKNINNHNLNHAIFNKGYYSFDPGTSLKNNKIKSIINNPVIKTIADYYCGFETELYTISTMLNVKRNIKHPVADFHRDTDDFVSLGFFIYWTDTDKNNGATSYKIGSHINNEPNNKKIEFIEVDAGSIVVGDWMGEHRGNEKIKNKERLITMLRFGRKFNQGYMQTKSYYFF